MRVFVVMLVVLAACRREQPPAPPQPPSPAQPVVDTVSPAQILESARTIARGQPTFAFDLYAQVVKARAGKAGGNVVVSPFAVASALAFTSAGAKGDTQTQLTRPLHAGDHLHPGFQFVNRPLMSAPQLAVANGLFVAGAGELLEPFVAHARDDYAAGQARLDFAKPEARAFINQWAGRQTRDRVAEVLPEGMVAADTQALLITASAFKGRFQVPFDPKATRPRPFAVADGKPVEVPTMTQPAVRLRVAEVDGVQALELPYRGGHFVLVVLLPPDLGAFEAGLDAAKFGALVAQLKPELVQTFVPRFKVEQLGELKPALQGLGITAAFEATADFSALVADGGVRLSSVVQKAMVVVNEDGAELGGPDAGTRVAATPTHVIDVSRPFMFVIRDVQSGVVVFIGRVVDPR